MLIIKGGCGGGDSAVVIFNLDDLSDVNAPTPADNEVLSWDAATSKWIPVATTGDHGALTGLTDDDHVAYHTDARGDARYYTQTELDAGQLDTRYYTETETDNLLGDKSDTGHAHATTDITSGTMADDRIAESNVTQHEGALSIAESQISDLDHDDTDAIHDNVAGEIAAIANKATPVDADFLVIEDSAAANAKKHITIGDLPGAAEVNDLTAAVTLADIPDGNVPESAVTQHEGAIDHDALTNLAAGEHRIINDAGTSATELWSASKINGALHDAAVVTGVYEECDYVPSSAVTVTSHATPTVLSGISCTVTVGASETWKVIIVAHARAFAAATTPSVQYDIYDGSNAKSETVDTLAVSINDAAALSWSDTITTSTTYTLRCLRTGGTGNYTVGQRAMSVFAVRTA